MSIVLVIQRYKMLQQAFAMALCPDHQVRVMDTVPDASALKDIDAAVVDAASLAAGDQAASFRMVQSWKLPTVWIDNDKTPPRQKQENLVVVTWPLHRDGLRKALAECLAAATKASSEARQIPAKTVANRSKQKVKEAVEALATDEPQFIELVEVVEDSPLVEEIQTSAQKR